MPFYFRWKCEGRRGEQSHHLFEFFLIFKNNSHNLNHFEKSSAFFFSALTKIFIVVWGRTSAVRADLSFEGGPQLNLSLFIKKYENLVINFEKLTLPLLYKVHTYIKLIFIIFLGCKGKLLGGCTSPLQAHGFGPGKVTCLYERI